MPIRVAYPKPESAPNVSVPPGHRSKCRKCGAVDSIRLVGERRLKRCAACGSTVAQRSAPVDTSQIITYEVLYVLNGEEIGKSTHTEHYPADYASRNFVERGPEAHTRVAHIVELRAGVRTGNARVLRYEKPRGRRRQLSSYYVGKGLVIMRGKGVSQQLISL